MATTRRQKKPEQAGWRRRRRRRRGVERRNHAACKSRIDQFNMCRAAGKPAGKLHVNKYGETPPARNISSHLIDRRQTQKIRKTFN